MKILPHLFHLLLHLSHQNAVFLRLFRLLTLQSVHLFDQKLILLIQLLISLVDLDRLLTLLLHLKLVGLQLGPGPILLLLDLGTLLPLPLHLLLQHFHFVQMPLFQLDNLIGQLLNSPFQFSEFILTLSCWLVQ